MTALAAPLDEAARPGRRIGHRVEVHPTIGSTNDRARELLRAGEEGVAVLAELQTDGRGRLGRTWTSPPGRNLMVSVALQPRMSAAAAWQVACAVAVAACDACRSVAPVELKWPNDIVDRAGRKLGGILVETGVDGDRLTEAVIGIGINVNWPRHEMPAEIAATATSLCELAEADVDRTALLGSLLDALETQIGAVENGVSPLSRYRAMCSTIGAAVLVEVGPRTIAGIATGLDAEGGLLVSEHDGGTVTVTSGEVVRLRPSGSRSAAAPSGGDT